MGWPIALDGDVVIVGTQNASGTSGPGSACVFRRSGSTWTEEQLLGPSGPDLLPRFGWGVALAADTAFVATSNAGGDGRVFQFTRSGGVWAERTVFNSPDGEAVAVEGGTALFFRGSAVDVHRLVGTEWCPGRLFVPAALQPAPAPPAHSTLFPFRIP